MPPVLLFAQFFIVLSLLRSRSETSLGTTFAVRSRMHGSHWLVAYLFGISWPVNRIITDPESAKD